MQAVSARSFAGQQVAARPAVQARVSDKPSQGVDRCQGAAKGGGLEAHGAPTISPLPYLQQLRLLALWGWAGGPWVDRHDADGATL